MKLDEFLDKFDFYIIGWSEAIKRQTQGFRKPKDIDVMIPWRLKRQFDDISHYLKYDISEYEVPGRLIFKIELEDKNIDLIIYKKDVPFKIIGNKKYLPIRLVAGHKMQLISADYDKNLSKKNKHMADIIWLYEKWYIFN